MATDVITLITQDHRVVEGLFERLKKKEGDQKAMVAELRALLIAHARAEEDRVYPGIDAHHSVEEHKEAEILLDSLVRARPGTAEFDQALDDLIESINHHVEEEETKLLPALKSSADAKELERLGTAFKQRRAEELAALGSPAEPSKAELYEQAQRADIPGRSQMDKEELSRALGENKF
ncbi:hemerythrin HHE cation binding domain-containing protein [Nonomuraea fuscirosea]|uniref:Hemerythrin HHE cation binding domain-containing protein n=1 Tax=Nonomuraea fuscirosea TaxID=1291556 RepID=A0A2T0NAH0_9ACTN|nr:hemerythrin domain-containing protein [Nonomuraea fuscirosea]PRX70007.1 hemerythrin HHE cation binding domain-containing protein [Nonomuraea fuscirosea]